MFLSKSLLNQKSNKTEQRKINRLSGAKRGASQFRDTFVNFKAGQSGASSHEIEQITENHKNYHLFQKNVQKSPIAAQMRIK